MHLVLTSSPQKKMSEKISFNINRWEYSIVVEDAFSNYLQSEILKDFSQATPNSRKPIIHANVKAKYQLFEQEQEINKMIEGFKYKKEIKFYLTTHPSSVTYITYRAKGIKIFIRKKLHKMLTQKELEVILHHELGHYYYRYLSLFGNTVILVVIITLPVVMHSLYMVIDSLLITYGIFIVYSFLSLLFYSNFHKLLEVLADRQSKKYTSKRRFIKVLKKSAKVFKKEKSSNTFYNLFFELHPSVKRRCSISYR